MLNYLDIYPLQLPARFHNKTACYTKVFIVSNIPLSGQYPNVQRENPITFEAFLRRIHKVFNFNVSKTESLPRDRWLRTDVNLLKPLSKAVQEELPF